MSGVVKVIPAKVNAALPRFIATPVVPMYIVCPIAAKVEDIGVPPTEGILVDSISVNHPFVSLDPVTPSEPVIVILPAPRARLPVKVITPAEVPSSVAVALR
jgi:hypothetical protein